MGILAKQQRKRSMQRQRGEMPIGPILIIALIVLPLVILLVVYGGKIAESFTAATGDVLEANDEAKTGLDKTKIEAPGSTT